MATQHPAIFAALASEFDRSEVKTRQGSKGTQLRYITARVVMNRLDEVLGPENWRDAYEIARDNSTICRLTITLPDGREVTKEGLGVTASSVGEDAEKGGESDALKRAAVKFGLGRYLYRDGVADFSADDAPAAAAPVAQAPPERRPSMVQALRDDARSRAREPGEDDGPSQAHAAATDDGEYEAPPRSGKALYAWVREQEQQHGDGLLRHLNGFAKAKGLPPRMVDFDADQIGLAFAEARRVLAQVRMPAMN